ncbi:acetyltransferase [Blastomyces gilchristii SLH14081]|uniref:Glucosamine 6-phosphate N-acetyltransferase n=1 Tax=Blastomyces gilchristii (strain SLH14081) TaxID=559298 RepID=A0A179UZ09_BLAGS|nr:acetyltransferase [Blastomyces gilchristii SLH14081]OAT12271.1 acetyltransferase [Blastomyces gilchristii SLH14081]
MGSTAQFTTSFLPPPLKSLTRPTDSNPAPANNPQIFNDAMHVRTVVFVDEQHCKPENEFDDNDARSWHWVLYATTTESEKPTPIGTLRLIPPPHEPNEHKLGRSYVALSRVALLRQYRGAGLARVLVEAALNWASEHHKALQESEDKPWIGDVLVHAQVTVEKMYARLGFVTDETMGTWVEEGMDHVGMWKTVEIPLE